MMRSTKLVLASAFVALAALYGSTFVPKASNSAQAAAASGACYFIGGVCRSQDPPSISRNDVLDGRTSGGALRGSWITSKANFIAHIEDLLANGSASDKRGAAYIVNIMVQAGTGGGNPAKDPTPSAAMIAEFETRILNPAVTLTAPTTRNITRSSFYDDVKKDDFLDTSYPGGIRNVIVFRYGGADAAIFELACGNFSGGLGLPAAPALDPAINVYGPTSVPCRNVATGLRYGLSRYGTSYAASPNYVAFTLPAGCNAVQFDHIIQVNRSSYSGDIPWSTILNQNGGVGGTFPPWQWLRQDRILNGPSGVGNHLVYSATVNIPNGQTWCERLYIDRLGTINSKLFNPDGNRYAGVCVTVSAVVVVPTISCTATAAQATIAPGGTNNFTVNVSTTNGGVLTNASYNVGTTAVPPYPPPGAWTGMIPLSTMVQGVGSPYNVAGTTYYATFRVRDTTHGLTSYCSASYNVTAPASWQLTPSLTITGCDSYSGLNCYTHRGGLISVNGIANNFSANASPGSGVNGAFAENTSGGASASGAWPNSAPLPSIAALVGLKIRTVSPTVTGAAGSNVCFSYSLSPGNSLGASIASNVVCAYIVSTANPNVIGRGSDVNAGSSCGAGSVIGGGTPSIQTSSSSYGEYVVTNFGSVPSLGFGSNNLAGSGATLNSYTLVCRPDLYASASLSTPVLAGGATVNVGTLSTGIHHYGGDITLVGNVNNKVTIVADGTVTVDSDIQVVGAGVRPRSQIPSLGVIARDGINVNAHVERIDGYFFSNGLISTCTEASLGVCGIKLTVNGFLMGHQLKLNRTGLTATPSNPFINTTNPIGEVINLTGQIYVNPPDGFGYPGSFNFLNYQGERPPLN